MEALLFQPWFRSRFNVLVTPVISFHVPVHLSRPVSDTYIFYDSCLILQKRREHYNIYIYIVCRENLRMLYIAWLIRGFFSTFCVFCNLTTLMTTRGQWWETVWGARASVILRAPRHFHHLELNWAWRRKRTWLSKLRLSQSIVYDFFTNRSQFYPPCHSPTLGFPFQTVPAGIFLYIYIYAAVSVPPLRWSFLGRLWAIPRERAMLVPGVVMRAREYLLWPP